MASIVALAVLIFPIDAASARRAEQADAAVWRSAIEVPGSGTLNPGGFATIFSIDCTGAGDCSAVGNFSTAPGTTTTPGDLPEPLVASEVNGAWGPARAVAGLGAMGEKQGQLFRVSCRAPGECVGVGYFDTGDLDSVPFMVTEHGGVWGSASLFPNVANLSGPGYLIASVFTVSCRGSGNCAVGGSISFGRFVNRAFVDAEHAGVWENATFVPGLATLDKGDNSQVSSVSCGASTSCTAVGEFTDSQGIRRPFVTVDTNGSWGLARVVRGVAVNPSDSWPVATADSIACTAAKACSVAGDLAVSHADPSEVYVATETSGRWTTGTELPGLSSLNTGRTAAVSGISCSAPGRCAIGGFYTTSRNLQQAFVANESGGKWGRAIELPGNAAFRVQGTVTITAISCGGPGSCEVVGWHEPTPPPQYGASQGGFVAAEVAGTWHAAVDIPGLASLNAGEYASPNSISCDSAGACGAGGFYEDAGGSLQAFVVNGS